MFYARDTEILRNSNILLKILSSRRVTRSQMHTEDPNIQGATVYNVVAMVTGRQGFLQPYFSLHSF